MMILIINIQLCILLVAAIPFLYYRHRLLRRQLDSVPGHLPLGVEQTAVTAEQPVPEEEQRCERFPMDELCDSDRNFLQRLIGFVNEEKEPGRVRIDSLASKMCLSRSQLNRKVHAMTGMSTI